MGENFEGFGCPPGPDFYLKWLHCLWQAHKQTNWTFCFPLLTSTKHFLQIGLYLVCLIWYFFLHFVVLFVFCISFCILYFCLYSFSICVCFPLSTSTQHFLLIGLSVPADSLMLPLFAARTHTTIIEKQLKIEKRQKRKYFKYADTKLKTIWQWFRELGKFDSQCVSSN